MAKKWSDKGISQTALKARQEDKNFEGKKKGFNRVSYLKEHSMFVPEEGINKVRIVQPLEVDELGYYGLDVYFHRGVGPAKGDYLCLKRMFGKSCYECDQQTSELWDNNPDLAKTYYPDHRILLWVVDLKAKKGDENYMKVLLWSCPKSLARDILGQSHKMETDVYVDVSHPHTGVGVFFKREGQGMRTKYTNVQLSDKALPLPDAILDQMKEFIDILVVPTYEDVKKVDSDEYEEVPIDAYSKEETHDETLDAEDAWDEEEMEGTMDNVEEEFDTDEESTEDCFQKEFDQWVECETCSKRAECTPKKEKKAKSKRTPKTPKTDATESDTGTEDKGRDVRNKLKKMINRARRS